MGIKPKNHGLKIKRKLCNCEDDDDDDEKNLLIEIDSINWYGTEYWLSVLKALNLIHHEFLFDKTKMKW